MVVSLDGSHWMVLDVRMVWRFSSCFSGWFRMALRLLLDGSLSIKRMTVQQ